MSLYHNDTKYNYVDGSPVIEFILEVIAAFAIIGSEDQAVNE